MRRSLRAALVALLLSASSPQAGAVTLTFDIIGGVVGTTRPPSPCSGGVQPGALGLAIDALRDRAQLGARRCVEGVRCQAAREQALRDQATEGLGEAVDAVCAGQASRALSSAAQAVQQLERAGLVSLPNAPLHGFAEQIVDAAATAVEAARDELDADVARLCASVRSQQGRSLDQVDQRLARADLTRTNGSASAALRELWRALQGVESVKKSIASAAARCWSQACWGRDGAFRAGAAGNPSLELVPADRGSVAVYRFASGGTARFGNASGTLRLVRRGVSGARATGELLTSVAPGPVFVDGDLSTQACLDSYGWLAHAKVAERFQIQNALRGRMSLTSNLLLVPGVRGLPATLLLPVVPQAARLRVGDESSQFSGFEGTIGSMRVEDSCFASHRVTAIEELRVEAGSFETARVDSSLRCAVGASADWTTWVASEIGFARFEMRTAQSVVSLELGCFGTAETPGACPADQFLPLRSAGGGPLGFRARSVGPVRSEAPDRPADMNEIKDVAARSFTRLEPFPGTVSVSTASTGLVVQSVESRPVELQEDPEAEEPP